LKIVSTNFRGIKMTITEVSVGKLYPANNKICKKCRGETPHGKRKRRKRGKVTWRKPVCQICYHVGEAK